MEKRKVDKIVIENFKSIKNLALDVKKRHMKLPKAARSNLKNLVSAYQTKSINAWKYRGKLYREWKGEEKESIANRSIANTPVGNLSYIPNSTITTETYPDVAKDIKSEKI